MLGISIGKGKLKALQARDGDSLQLRATTGLQNWTEGICS